MAAVPKKLYANKPSTGNTTLYTVPANTKTIIKNILICNTSALAAIITVSAAGQNIISGMRVDPNDTVSMDISLVMETSDTLTASQGTSGAISLYVSGVEVA